MDRLEQYIKDHFKQTGAKTPDMMMWSDISNELDKKQNRRYPIPFWWLLPIASIIGGGLYLINNGNKIFNTTSSSVINKVTDTIYIEKTIVKYDTIYKENVVYKYITQTQTNELTLSNIKEDLKLKSFENLNKVSNENMFYYGSQNTFAKNNNVDNYPLINDANEKENRETSTFDYLEIITPKLIHERSLMIVNSDHLINLRKRKNQSIDEFLKPKAIFIGAGGGLSKILFNEKNYSLGSSFNAELNIAFSRELSLWVNAGRTIDMLHSDKMNPNEGVPFVETPNENYNFLIAESSIHGITLDIGLQYFFMKGNRLQPSIGLGYGIRKEFDYELLYDFKNSVTDEELSFERIIDHNISKYKFLNLRFGTIYHLNSRFKLEGNLYYKNQIGSSQLLIRDLLKPEIRFMYRIK